VRVEPLGLDRRRNRYWWLPPGEGEPRAGTGRVFVEGADGGAFRLLAKARARHAPLKRGEPRCGAVRGLTWARAAEGARGGAGCARQRAGGRRGP